MERIKYLVEPVNSSSWNGIKRYTNSKEGIRAATVANDIPLTGLTVKQETVIMVDGTKKKVFGTQDQLEQEMRLPKDALRAGSKHNPNPFWVNFVVMLDGGGVNEIDASTTEGYLDLLFLTAQPQVKVGRENIESMTEWVITSPEDDVETDNTRRELYHAAIAAILGAAPEQRRAAMYVLDTNPAGHTDKVVYNLLDDLAINEPEKVTEILKDVNLLSKAFVNECVFKRQLVKRGDAYFHGNKLVGESLSAAVTFLYGDNGEKLLIELKENLKR